MSHFDYGLDSGRGRTERSDYHSLLFPKRGGTLRGGALRAVRALHRPLVTALSDVDLTDYSVLLGDDRAGRIPTLVVRHIANRERAAAGLPRIGTAFFQPAKRTTEFAKERSRAWDLTDSWLQKYPGRVLVVTEYVDSGQHLKQISALLKSSGRDFDVVAVTSDMSQESLRRARILTEGARLFRGGSLIPKIYDYSEIVGGLKKTKYITDPVHKEKAHRRNKQWARTRAARVAVLVARDVQRASAARNTATLE